jgi:hypothetical protein
MKANQSRPPAHFGELTPLDGHALAPFLRIKLIGQFCWPIGCVGSQLTDLSAVRGLVFRMTRRHTTPRCLSARGKG